jgi:hypothetical protein
MSTFISQTPKEEFERVDTILRGNQLIAYNFAIALLSDSWEINPTSKDTLTLYSKTSNFSFSDSILSFDDGSKFRTDDSVLISQYRYMDSVRSQLINDKSPNNASHQKQRIYLLNNKVRSFNDRQYILARNNELITSIRPFIKYSSTDSAGISVADVSYNFKTLFNKKYDLEFLAIYDSIFILVDSLGKIGSSDQENRFASSTTVSKYDVVKAMIDKLLTRLGDLNDIRSGTGVPYTVGFDEEEMKIFIDIISNEHKMLTRIDAPYPNELKDCKLSYTPGLHKLLEAKDILTKKLMSINFNRSIPDACRGLIDEAIFKIAYNPE